MSYFSDEQISLLLKPIHPNRVSNLRGLSYVEGYDIRAELTRIFGFGRWSEETLDQQLVCESETKTKSGGNAWYVVYRTRIRLVIFSPDGEQVCYYDGAHVGESTHPVRGEAHGNALTNSQTYALRRCAINLGDQFGLSLYNKGSMDPIVRWTLVRPESVPADTEDVPIVSPEETVSDPVETISESKPRTRQAKVEAKATPLTLGQLITLIAEAKTVDKLRAAFKEAGTAGRLDEQILLPSTGEKLSVRDWLFRRSDELGAIKSGGDTKADPGISGGAE